MITKRNRKCEENLEEYERGRNEYGDVNKNVKKSVWSKWFYFIRGYWCFSTKKTTNPANIYAGVLNTDVLDVNCGSAEAKVEIQESFRDDLVLPTSEFFYTVENDEDAHRNQEDERLRGNLGYFFEETSEKNLSPSKLYFGQKTKQDSQSVLVPTLQDSRWDSKDGDQPSRDAIQKSTDQSPISELSVIEDSCRRSNEPTWREKADIYYKRQVEADVNNYLDEFMARKQGRNSTSKFSVIDKQPKEKKKVKFDIEFSNVLQRGFPRKELSRQVPPEVLVNIKPFKKHIKKPDTTEIEAVQRMEKVRKNVNLGSGGIRKESKNIHFNAIAQKNKAPPLRSFSDTGKLILRSVTPLESLAVHFSPNHIISSYNELQEKISKMSLDDVLENVDDKDHNIIFKRNMTQFRRKIIKVEGKEDEDVGEEEIEEEKIKYENLENKREPKNYKAAIEKTGKFEIGNVLEMQKREAVAFGIRYELITEFNILEPASVVRKEIHLLNISQGAWEIHQLHDSYFKTEVKKRESSMTKLFFREILKIHTSVSTTSNSLNEFPVENEIPCVCSDASECLTCKALEQIEPLGETSNVMDFLQEYSELLEKSYSCRDVEFEKIFSTVEEGFGSFRLTESERETYATNITVAVRDLAGSHRVVEIVNNPVPEYFALIYQKTFLEFYLRNTPRQAVKVSSDTSLTDEFLGCESRQHELKQTNSFDSLQILYSGNVTLDEQGYESPQLYDLDTEKDTHEGKKENSLTALVDGEKISTFKYNSFPRKVNTAKGISPQKLCLIKNTGRCFKQKRRIIEKELNFNKRIDSVQSDSEEPVKIETCIVESKKFTLPNELKSLMGKKNTKMFYTEKNPGKVGKELIAAFNSITDLNEGSRKTSVVIMVTKK